MRTSSQHEGQRDDHGPHRVASLVLGLFPLTRSCAPS